MKKCRKFISILFTAVLMLTTVLSNVAYAAPKALKPVNTPAEETEWNVYVYMCGTNLESEYENATENLNSLMKADYSEDVRFIIQTGGTEKWHNDWVDADKLQRFVIQGSNKTLVWEDEIRSMAYPDTLSDFLNWGKEYYPAKKSMLIVWDHGSAYKGAVRDERYDDEQLSIPDYVKAFTDADVHFDIIDFDCCLMADLDVCLNLAPYTDYLLVSEEVEEGCGQDYRTMGNYLAFNPACSGKTLGKVVCGSYIDGLHNRGITETNGLSLIDTSKLPAVREAFLEMIGSMTEMMSDTENFSNMLRAAYASKGYYRSEEKDLVSFARSVASFVGDDISSDVIDAVRKAVAAKAQTTESTYNNGISFYWAPCGYTYDIETYSRVTDMNEYLAFIDAIIWEVNMPSRVYKNTERLKQLDYDDYAIRYEMQEDKGVFDTLKITGGTAALNSIYYNIYGTYNDRLIKISKLGNISFDQSGTKFRTEFDGRVETLNGEPVVLNVISETPDYILYNAPVYIEKEGECELRNLRVAYIPDESDDNETFIGSVMDEDQGSFIIVGMEKELTTSAADSYTRDSVRIDEGMIIYPAYPTADGNTLIKGNPVEYDSNTAITSKQLDDGTYYLDYEIGSSLGQTLITETEEFQITEGKITAPEITDETDDNDSAEETAEEIFLEYHENGSYHLNKVSYKKYHGKEFEDKYVKKESSTEEAADADTASEDENGEEPAKVTLMAFMIDYNNEGNLGVFTQNIESFMQAEDSDKVNVLLQTGGGSGWKADCFDTDTVQRFEIHHDTLVEVSKEPQYNMSTEASLEDYIKWCAANYPAEHYIIEFFDHGGAWYGVCWDEKYGSNLALDDISTAMKNSGLHFDMTYFNMCLMSTLETAAAIQPYSDYMLASEESTMAVKKSEGDMVNYIIRHADDLDAAELGKFKAESFMGDIENVGFEDFFQSLSVVDLSKIPAVIDAVDQMGREMSGIAKDPAKLTRLIRGLNSSRKYSYDFMRDIVDLARHADGVSTASKNAVANAVNDAVYYLAANKDYVRNGGLSIHFEVNGGLDSYADVCPAKDYLAFLDCINLGHHVLPEVMTDDRRQESVSPLDFVIKNSLEIADDSRVSLIMENSPEIVNDISYRVMEYDADQDKYYYMYSGTDIDIDESEGRLTENFDGRTTALGGKYCYMYKYETDDDRILFNIPVKYNDTNYNIRVAYSAPEDTEDDATASETDTKADKKAGKESAYSFIDDRIDFDNGIFKILGLFEEEDVMNGYPDFPNIELRKGMELILQIPETDSEGNLLGYVDGETISWDNDMNISLKGMQDGDYVLGYVTTNGLLRKTMSDTADICIKNGRIKTVEYTN